MYKRFDGKAIENFYLNDGQVLSSQQAIEVIEETHDMWNIRGDRMGMEDQHF
jgi:hypothetical protein